MEATVREDLLSLYPGHPFSDTWHRKLETLTHELDSGRISTFDEVESLLNSQMDILEPEPARHAAAISALCRGAQATFNFRKVDWFLDQIRRAPSLRASMGERGEAKAPRSPLADANAQTSFDLRQVPHGQPPPFGAASTIPTTPPTNTSPTRKRKRKPVSALGGKAPAVWNSTQCPHCTQTFCGTPGDQRSNLTRHLGVKHPDTCARSTSVCPECGKDFPRSDYLLNHRRRVHSLPQ